MSATRTTSKKLGRERDQRSLVLRTLAVQLIEHRSITTNTGRAKTLVPFIERLVSRSRTDTLANRRFVAAKLGNNKQAVRELFDVIAPQLNRTSGFVRTLAAPARSGDGASRRTIAFVDDIQDVAPQSKQNTKKTASTKNKSGK
jgi:large subunit ribosomal protein L17